MYMMNKTILDSTKSHRFETSFLFQPRLLREPVMGDEPQLQRQAPLPLRSKTHLVNTQASFAE